jgi:hypothetical protein
MRGISRSISDVRFVELEHEIDSFSLGSALLGVV